MSAAAFFDMDGTLLPPPSLERQFLRFLSWRKELHLAQRARWAGRFLRSVWSDPLAATHGNKGLYAGVRVSCLDSWITLVRRHGFASIEHNSASFESTQHISASFPFFPLGLNCLAWHAAQRHRIFLITGTLRPVAHAVADALAKVLSHRLGFEVPLSDVATELEIRDGRFTGHVVGAAVCGPQKARALEELAARHGLDFASSFAYANSFADRWMLSRVGHPVAVNPSLLLRLLARRRGWPVAFWTAGASRPERERINAEPAVALQHEVRPNRP